MVECQLPKLDAVGSNPISRSMFSMSYGQWFICRNPLIEVTRVSEVAEVIDKLQLERLVGSLPRWKSQPKIK